MASLTEGRDYSVSNGTEYTISRQFLRERPIGTSGLQFEFQSGIKLKLDLIIVDSTALEAALQAAKALDSGSVAYPALQEAIQEAENVLSLVNRTLPGSGNNLVTQSDLDAQTADLEEAISEYNGA
ncbi:hypothetical protein D3C77_609480 [compost metagenome]